jgi:hypothetical protein
MAKHYPAPVKGWRRGAMLEKLSCPKAGGCGVANGQLTTVQDLVWELLNLSLGGTTTASKSTLRSRPARALLSFPLPRRPWHRLSLGHTRPRKRLCLQQRPPVPRRSLLSQAAPGIGATGKTHILETFGAICSQTQLHNAGRSCNTIGIPTRPLRSAYLVSQRPSRQRDITHPPSPGYGHGM